MRVWGVRFLRGRGSPVLAILVLLCHLLGAGAGAEAGARRARQTLATVVGSLDGAAQSHGAVQHPISQLCFPAPVAFC